MINIEENITKHIQSTRFYSRNHQHEKYCHHWSWSWCVSVAKDLAKSKHFPNSTHRIILIDRNQFAYWPIGSLRASVLLGFEEKVMNSLQKVFDKNSKHFVLSGIIRDQIRK